VIRRLSILDIRKADRISEIVDCNGTRRLRGGTWNFWFAPLSYSRKPPARCSSKSRNPRAQPCQTGSTCETSDPGTTCFQAGVTSHPTWGPGNTL